MYFNSAIGAGAFDVTPGQAFPNAKHVVLFIGGDGDVAVTTKQGDNITFTGLTAGSILPVFVKAVRTSGTTATGLVGII